MSGQKEQLQELLKQNPYPFRRCPLLDEYATRVTSAPFRPSRNDMNTMFAEYIRSPLRISVPNNGWYYVMFMCGHSEETEIHRTYRAGALCGKCTDALRYGNT